MCARCNQSYPRDHEYIRKWLTTDCPMLNSSIDKPRPIPLALLHVGSKSVHVSHKINIFRGLMYCRKCGCRASTQGVNFIEKLSHPCAPPGPYGQDNLNRFALGKLPRRVVDWPLSLVDVSAGTLENRVASYPLSDFEQQIVSDHPELTVAECKIVAKMLSACAEFANRQGNKSN